MAPPIHQVSDWFARGGPAAREHIVLATKVGLDAGQLVLAWTGQREAPVIAIANVSRPQQVRSAWQAVTTERPDGLLTTLSDTRRGLRTARGRSVPSRHAWGSMWTPRVNGSGTGTHP